VRVCVCVCACVGAHACLYSTQRMQKHPSKLVHTIECTQWSALTGCSAHLCASCSYKAFPQPISGVKQMKAEAFPDACGQVGGTQPASQVGRHK